MQQEEMSAKLGLDGTVFERNIRKTKMELEEFANTGHAKFVHVGSGARQFHHILQEITSASPALGLALTSAFSLPVAALTGLVLLLKHVKDSAEEIKKAMAESSKRVADETMAMVRSMAAVDDELEKISQRSKKFWESQEQPMKKFREELDAQIKSVNDAEKAHLKLIAAKKQSGEFTEAQAERAGYGVQSQSLETKRSLLNKAVKEAEEMEKVAKQRAEAAQKELFGHMAGGDANNETIREVKEQEERVRTARIKADAPGAGADEERAYKFEEAKFNSLTRAVHDFKEKTDKLTEAAGTAEKEYTAVNKALHDVRESASKASDELEDLDTNFPELFEQAQKNVAKEAEANRDKADEKEMEQWDKIFKLQEEITRAQNKPYMPGTSPGGGGPYAPKGNPYSPGPGFRPRPYAPGSPGDIKNRIKDLQDQAQDAENRGDPELAKRLREQVEGIPAVAPVAPGRAHSSDELRGRARIPGLKDQLPKGMQDEAGERTAKATRELADLAAGEGIIILPKMAP